MFFRFLFKNTINEVTIKQGMLESFTEQLDELN